MGGTKRKDSGSAANGLYVHLKCHMDIESNRSRAFDNGWLVSQFAEPKDIPVKLWNGWFMLDPDGSLNQVTEIEEVINSESIQG